jgi:hypothetical protein
MIKTLADRSRKNQENSDDFKRIAHFFLRRYVENDIVKVCNIQYYQSITCFSHFFADVRKRNRRASASKECVDV